MGGEGVEGDLGGRTKPLRRSLPEAEGGGLHLGHRLWSPREVTGAMEGPEIRAGLASLKAGHGAGEAQRQ